MRVETNARVGKLSHVDRAHADHACAHRCVDKRPIGGRRRRIAQHGRPCGRHRAFQIKQILPRQRHTIHQTGRIARAQPFARGAGFSFGAGAQGADEQGGIIVAVDTIKHLSHQINRVAAPVAQRACQILNGADRHIRPLIPRSAWHLAVPKQQSPADRPPKGHGTCRHGPQGSPHRHWARSARFA